MECTYCESEKRKLWPANRAPKLEEVSVGNWQKLLKCKKCNTLWVEVPHEPYASYNYTVLWPFDIEAWQKLHNYDEGNSIHKWHQQQIMKEGPILIGKDQEAIIAHESRSSGIEPYNNSSFEHVENLENLLKKI